MATSWRELLELARAIGAEMEGEAARRAAASRAYYAAWHCACEKLGIRDYIGHAPLVRALMESGSDPLVKAGRLLNQARRRRVHADYRLERAFSEQDMRACIEAAAKAAGMLEG